jgi:hypothetical protein
MADADPRVDYYTAKAVEEVGNRFGARASAHDVGVRRIYLRAWASCVSGRLDGGRRRVPGGDFQVRKIAEDRDEKGLEAQVVGRFVRAWFGDMRAIDIASEGYVSDVVRVHLAVSAVILSVVDDLPVSDTVKRGLKRSCVRTKDSSPIVEGVIEHRRDLYLDADLRPPRELGQALEYFGEGDNDNAKYGKLLDDLLELAQPFFERKLLRPLRGTENLLGEGVPKNRLLRELAHADIDAFIERRYAVLADDPYVGREDEELPTPNMLGVFPHPPGSKESWRERAGTDALYEDSLEFLTELSDAMTARGFAPTAPVIDAAIGALAARAARERVPPAAGDLVDPERPAVVDLAGMFADEGRAAPIQERANALLVGQVHVLRAAALAAIAAQLGREVLDPVEVPELSAHEREIVAWLARSAVEVALEETPVPPDDLDEWGEAGDWDEWAEPDDFEEGD